MSRSLEDVILAYEEAQQELELMVGFEEQYPDHYSMLLAERDRTRAEYEAAVGKMQCVEPRANDEALPASGERVALSCEAPDETAEPRLVCGGGDTLFIDAPTGLNIQAHCEHGGDGRIAKAGQILKVVGDVSSGDTVTLQNLAGEATSWASSRGTVEVVDASRATVVAHAGLVKNFWLLTIDPTVHVVEASADGETQSLEIHAYPATEVAKGYALDKAIIERIKTGTELLSDQLATWLGFEIELVLPSGELKFSGAWKEGDSGRDADWTFKAEGKVTILGVRGRYKIGTDRLTRVVRKIPGIGDYVARVVDWLADANIGIEAAAVLSVAAAFDSQKASSKTIATIEATGSLKLFLEVSLVGDDVVSVDADVGASIVPNGGLGWDQEGVFVRFGVKFGGLKGQVTIKVAWGLLTHHASWTLIDEFDMVEPTAPWYPKVLL